MTAEVLLLCGTEALPLFKGTLDALANVLPHATRVELPRLNHGAAKTRAANPRSSPTSCGGSLGQRPIHAVDRIGHADDLHQTTGGSTNRRGRDRLQHTVHERRRIIGGEVETSWTASEIATASGTSP